MRDQIFQVAKAKIKQTPKTEEIKSSLGRRKHVLSPQRKWEYWNYRFISSFKKHQP